MTRIDPSRMQALISQKFDSAQAPGQLGGHSVRIIDPPGPRLQPSASGFINKVKSLYDRDIRLQRAEEGVTRGVKSVDKALGKLLDAMNPGSEGKIDFAKVLRRLEALPGSAKSATSRGADFNELLGARLKQMAKETLYKMYDTIVSAVENRVAKYQDNKLPPFYFERKHFKQLLALQAVFRDALAARGVVAQKSSSSKVETDSDRKANFNKALDDLLEALTPNAENKIDPHYTYYLNNFSGRAKAMDRDYNLNYKLIKKPMEVYANNLNNDRLEKSMAGIEIAIKKLDEKYANLDQKYQQSKTINYSDTDLNSKKIDVAKQLQLIKEIEKVFSNELKARRTDTEVTVNTLKEASSKELEGRDIAPKATEGTAVPMIETHLSTFEQEGLEIFGAVLDMLGIPKDSESKNLASKSPGAEPTPTPPKRNSASATLSRSPPL